MRSSTLARSAGLTAATIVALLLSGVAQAQTHPEETLGFAPGADFHLATYEQAIEYFDVLADETDRMIMRDMGETSEGRRMRYAVISSPENLAGLDEFKEIGRRLSLARGVSPEEADELAESGRAIVWIDGGLHATEVAPAQHNIQLAYDMVTGEDRRTRFIRDNVILVLVFANPDGMTIVSDWYQANVGTEYETSRLPVLYQKYAGHDNNRDSMMSNLVETRNMNRATSHEWLPVILYNHHQTAPFPARIFIPPEAESTNPNVHPLVVRWKNLIGAAMGRAFEEADMPGAISRINFDSWWPGYVTQIVESHNIPAILTETALYRYATPYFYTLNDFPESHRDLVVGTFYPSPWRGGWWRLGDAVDYCLTASMAVLEVAAKYRYEFLHNKWKMATDVIERYRAEPPYGWIIPRVQRDPNTTATLLDRLMVLGVEVYVADEPFVHSGIVYPAGSYVIPTSQPFGLFVKNVMEIQDFPDLREHPHLWQGIVSLFRMDDALPLQPYDGVGWTLPLQMGVESRAMIRPLDQDVKLSLIAEPPRPAGRIRRAGSEIVFAAADNQSYSAVSRILAEGGRVGRAEEAFALAGETFARGTFVVDANSIDSDTLRSIAEESHVPMTGGSVDVKLDAVTTPRLALYKSWVASMDAGWIRLVLERHGFEHHLLTDAEVRAGNLHERFDAIILPDQWPRSIVEGHRKGTIHPDYVGGISATGVENLERFVEHGGTLISNKSSNDLLIKAFRLPLRNVVRGISIDEFNIPGSIVRMRYDPAHHLAYGMPEHGVAYFAGGARGYEIVTAEGLEREQRARASDAGSDGVDPDQGEGAYGEESPSPDSRRGGNAERADADRYDTSLTVTVAARYPEESLLLSGWQVGEERLRGAGAVVEVPIEKGRVVLLGFNVQNRAHSFATFKLLFNAILSAGSSPAD